MEGKGGNRLHIVSDRCERKLRTVVVSGIRIYRHGRGAAVWATEGVEAGNKKPTRVKRLSGADERAPPVRDVGRAREGMADYHGIVAPRVESSPGLVGDGNMGESDAGLEGELGDDRGALASNEGEEWVLWLLPDGHCDHCQRAVFFLIVVVAMVGLLQRTVLWQLGKRRRRWGR